MADYRRQLDEKNAFAHVMWNALLKVASVGGLTHPKQFLNTFEFGSETVAIMMFFDSCLVGDKVDLYRPLTAFKG
jgi:hypothetical protein